MIYGESCRKTSSFVFGSISEILFHEVIILSHAPIVLQKRRADMNPSAIVQEFVIFQKYIC